MVKNIIRKKATILVVMLVLIASIVQLNLLVGGVQTILAGRREVPVQIEKNVPVNSVPKEVIIEKINLDLPVVSVPLTNGTWEVHADVANYAEGTSLVNDKSGNVGIYAHDRQKGFTNIKNLIAGDIIMLKGDNFKATYTVQKTGLANPIDVDILYATEKPQLTLLTCDGVISAKRYIVKANLVNIEKI